MALVFKGQKTEGPWFIVRVYTRITNGSLVDCGQMCIKEDDWGVLKEVASRNERMSIEEVETQ